jgi:hypothetical protein
VKVLADGDSLPAALRDVIERRAAAESKRAATAGSHPPFDLVYVASRRLKVSWPALFVLVEAGPGAADERIIELAEPGDLALTRDLPLAEALVDKGITVLNDRGTVFTIENARERRSLRDLALEFRGLGIEAESPRATTWGKVELKGFSDAFDRELGKALRRNELLKKIGHGGTEARRGEG